MNTKGKNEHEMPTGTNKQINAVVGTDGIRTKDTWDER